ncbi:heme-binding domain-containing protein [Aquimarina sp. 2201CG14-23]|uniref:heme-binding domain-containing protein n=1 Tax=Aquimarina mycalae TaxID=3040073 RepID=UPI002478243F|nr:heme-binding domain-containing protein [Aquimarina sp. 2201CG14-23]MDH7446968.1 heme-binding domain-containing protein [Aquimarina sp. 2201CG14-23]
MKSVFKKIGLLVLLALIVMQFIRPDKNESGYESVAFFENEVQPTPEIKELLKSNCYDCHSNQTVYPWYAEVAPVSYWLAHHVDEGKEHFNVSDWQQYSDKKKDHKLEELIEEVEEGEMPLDSYTWIHGNLEESDKELLIKWAQELRKKYTSKE